MAKALLYPTIGLLWEAELFDPELSAAYCRAYNRWIADFRRDSGGRLIPIAHLSLGDPAEAARELERAVKNGCKGAFVCPFTIDPDERTIAAMMSIVGEDRFFWATDYPHPDHPANYLEELREMIAPMSPSTRRAVLGENVARAYALS